MPSLEVPLRFILLSPHYNNVSSYFQRLVVILLVSEMMGFLCAGPRELGGARDLITQYKLLPHHEFFCKRSLPESLSDAHYLHNVVGDTDIRKGEGMQLDQLIPNASHNRDTNARIQPFVLDELKEAFELNDTSPVELPPVRIYFPSIWI